METSQPMIAVTPAPTQIVELARQRGPFVTVYLTTEATIDNAQQRSTQRWKTLRADLVEQGAPVEVLATIDPLVGDAHLRGQCLAVVAAADGDPLVEHRPDPPASDVGRWGPLPVFGPLLEWHQQSVPHVTVVIDRLGADLAVFGPLQRESVTHVGDSDDPISKASPGGWSQRRYQQRAENSWEENAKDVAAELTNVVEEIGARLVVVAGDVRAVQLLREHLDRSVDDL